MSNYSVRAVCADFFRWKIFPWFRRVRGYWENLGPTSEATWRYIIRLAKGRANPQEISSLGELFGRHRVWAINLDRRPDRWAEVEEEFARLDLAVPRRFTAIEDINGHLGCSRSHEALLNKYSIDAGGLPLAIFEDDIEFLANRAALDRLVAEFLTNPAVDVLALGFNTKSWLPRVGRNLRILTQSLTTSGYIVKGHAISQVLGAASESVNLFNNGKSPSEASIDVVWQSLQAKELVFVTSRVRSARQRASFSDISGAHKKRRV